MGGGGKSKIILPCSYTITALNDKSFYLWFWQNTVVEDLPADELDVVDEGEDHLLRAHAPHSNSGNKCKKINTNTVEYKVLFIFKWFYQSMSNISHTFFLNRGHPMYLI